MCRSTSNILSWACTQFVSKSSFTMTVYLAQQQEFMSAACIVKGQMGSEAHAQVLALTRGVDLESLDLAW